MTPPPSFGTYPKKKLLFSIAFLIFFVSYAGFQTTIAIVTTAIHHLNLFTMAKNPTKVVKLQIKAGMANPAPPIGTALGPTGIQIAEFCKQFNDATKDRMGTVLPTIINIYDDRTFSFVTKQPPMTFLIKTELNLKSGSKLPHKDKVAHLTDAQLTSIAQAKMPDLNANSLEMAKSIVAGSARSMGITSDLKK